MLLSPECGVIKVWGFTKNKNWNASKLDFLVNFHLFPGNHMRCHGNRESMTIQSLTAVCVFSERVCLNGHLGILSRDEASWWKRRGCDATPRSRGDDGDAACHALCGRWLWCCPLPVSSIVSLLANGQPPVGQSFPAAPCTPRTAVNRGGNNQYETKCHGNHVFHWHLRIVGKENKMPDRRRR